MKRKDYHKSNHFSLNIRNKRAVIEKEKKSFKSQLLRIAFLIIIILVIYFLFFSPFFKIKKIIIAGSDRAGEIAKVEKITQDFLSHNRFLVLSQKNIFILSKSGLREVINNNFDLEDINIETKLPHVLKIEIKAKTPVLIWQEGDKYFTVYNDGIIKNKIDSISQYELPIVNRGTTSEIIIGQQYLLPSQVDYVQKLFSLFDFYFKNLHIQKFEIAGLRSREVKLLTSKGWYMLFNLDLDPRESLKTAKAVLDQKIKNKNNLHYIDLRIRDKIYYK